jgi:hypothetical protein
MRVCPYCNLPIEEGDNFCSTRTCPPIGQCRKWSPNLEHSTVLHWMAQAYRRLEVPLDSTEDAGWSAFEYAWKALHHLCESLEHGESAAEKIHRALSGRVSDTETLVRTAQVELEGVLTVLTERRNAKSVEYDPIIKLLKEQMKSLFIEIKEAINHDDFDLAVEKISTMLARVRNKRTHVSPANIRLVDSTFTSSAYQNTVSATTDFADVLLEMSRHLLAAISQYSLDDIDSIVLYRKLQLLAEIKDRMTELVPEHQDQDYKKILERVDAVVDLSWQASHTRHR